MVDYNYDFLRQWFEQTGTTYREVMRAVGNSSANNLHDWIGDGPAQKKQKLKGEQVHPIPMNIGSMLRFCNHYHVSLSSFFVEDGKPVVLGCQNDNAVGGCQNNNVGGAEQVERELAHLREITQMKDEARQREDAIRHDYDARLRQREQELQEIIRMKDEEIRRLREAGK